MNSRPAIDRPIGGEAVVDGEERVAQAGGLEHVEILAQLHVLGELVKAIGGRRNLGVAAARPLGRGCVPRYFSTAADELPGGLQLGQHFLGKPPAELLFERSEDFHPFERIHSGFDDRRVERHAVGPFLGHAADFFDAPVASACSFNGSAAWPFLPFFDGGRRPAAVHAASEGRRRWPAASAAEAVSCAASAARHSPTIVERAGQIAVAAGMPLDLAAGGLRHAAGPDQHDRVQGQFVFAGHRAANRRQTRRRNPTACAARLPAR